MPLLTNTIRALKGETCLRCCCIKQPLEVEAVTAAAAAVDTCSLLRSARPSVEHCQRLLTRSVWVSLSVWCNLQVKLPAAAGILESWSWSFESLTHLLCGVRFLVLSFSPLPLPPPLQLLYNSAAILRYWASAAVTAKAANTAPSRPPPERQSTQNEGAGAHAGVRRAL